MACCFDQSSNRLADVRCRRQSLASATVLRLNLLREEVRKGAALLTVSMNNIVSVMDHSDEALDVTPAEIDPDRYDEKVVINVGGIRHEILVSSLIEKAGTRLCNLVKYHIRNRREEYFFNRHPGVFSSVMDYYRTGELHVPLDICGAVVKRELDYWKIDGALIEPCCWTNYSSYINKQKTLSDFNKSMIEEDTTAIELKNSSGWRRTQMKIWMILDLPRSSQLAMAFAVTSFMFVLISIFGFCLETLPIMFTIENVTRQCGPGQRNETVPTVVSMPFLTYLDYICTAFFTLELLVRVLFAPNKFKFFHNIMNIIDILALLPLYVQIILDLTDTYYCLKNHRAILEAIFILRIIRIFRIFHLVKHYKALKILVHAIKASFQELLMLAIFLFIATLVFSTLIFYAERPIDYTMITKSEFRTIPIGFWWSIITMTTVGYGDVYPSHAMGYLVGVLCAVCGVLLEALTIPVISNNFALFYLHARTREEITKQNDKRKPRSKPSEDSCEGVDQRNGDGNSDSLIEEEDAMANGRRVEASEVEVSHQVRDKSKFPKPVDKE